jgi:hypothetical protein
MNIELNPAELAVLRQALAAWLERLQDEVAHTEHHPLQHSLRRDMDELEHILHRLDQSTPPPAPTADVG